MFLSKAIRGVIPKLGQRNVAYIAKQLAPKIEEYPMREAVKYERQNLKWTASDFMYYSDAHANAVLDLLFKNGDKILLFFPECHEKHTAMIAAAKGGLHVVDCYPGLVSTVDEMRSLLTLSGAKGIYFHQETSTQSNLKLLRKAIPDFFYYDDTYGATFHSKHFPTLKYFIHTGYDPEIGCLRFEELYNNSPSTDFLGLAAAQIDESTPLYTEITKDKDGKLVASPTLSQKQVFDHPKWFFVQKMFNQEYFEVKRDDC